MTALGFGSRAALLAWVAATAVVVVLGSGLGLWGEILTEPSGPGAEATADPGIVEAYLLAPLVGVWLAVIAQVVLLPLAVVVGLGATGWASGRRRVSRRPRRRRPTTAPARPARDGSR
jgi:hypothetical protein